jgi:endonuclease-3
MPDLAQIVARLQKHYGKLELPPAQGPFELVVWENACYLLPDQRRLEVFEALRDVVGLTAEAIWKADRNVLFPLAVRGGMRPETRVFRWREIARVTLEQFGGNLDQILDWPYAKAKKALKLFPNIGDPGAEKILMFCGAAEGLPLESNGVRVLTRIGFGRTEKAYGKMLRSVQDALQGQLPRTAATLSRAHLLLRQHGREICHTNGPVCGDCPVVDLCSWALKQK